MVNIGEGKSFVMADIPGLIEGASDGIGLGHDFLRHVERCRLIVHIVDISGIEGRDAIEDFKIINHELANFSEDLSMRPQIVVANKCDMADTNKIEEFKAFVLEKGYQFHSISAVTTQGTKDLVYAVAQMLATLPPIKEYEPQPLTAQERFERENQSQRFEITVEDGVYYVEGEFLETILIAVNMEDYESLQYLQRVLRSTGIIDKLEEMGINEGDTVSICNFQFDFVL